MLKPWLIIRYRICTRRAYHQYDNCHCANYYFHLLVTCNLGSRWKSMPPLLTVGPIIQPADFGPSLHQKSASGSSIDASGPAILQNPVTYPLIKSSVWLRLSWWKIVSRKSLSDRFVSERARRYQCTLLLADSTRRWRSGELWAVLKSTIPSHPISLERKLRTFPIVPVCIPRYFFAAMVNIDPSVIQPTALSPALVSEPSGLIKELHDWSRYDCAKLQALAQGINTPFSLWNIPECFWIGPINTPNSFHGVSPKVE
jgi:hypothetical protein